MKKLITIAAFVFSTGSLLAQAENSNVRKGNQLYKKGKISEAEKEFAKAVQQNPSNPTANFNLGNARFRKNEFAEAEKDFDNSLNNNPDNTALQQKALYNKGVSLSKQKKLQESIDAYKKALRLNPADEDTRVNLQKALEELRKQQESQKKPEDKPQQQKENKQKQPPPPTNKKRLEQQLKSLQQKEQEIQEKMQNRGRAGSQPDKDW
ncbi:MAG: tetratricopeptide repeat protein [Chitinophagaceae bacterium]|nr:tetratricopeptide repeat protein [Chitinophagaceae bacterium]